MSDQTLTDVVLAVDALIDEFGWEAFANEIPVWEAEERRADGKIKRFHHQRERIFRAALDDERLRNLEGDPPKPAWEPGGGRVATKDGSTFVECWLPPKIRDDNEPAAPGLIPIPKTMTHRERGVLLAAVHYRYAVGADCVIDPERVSFLDGRSPGFGPFGILVAMVESLTDADAPILMTMVEKVRKEFAERSGGQQAEMVEIIDRDGGESFQPVSALASKYGVSQDALRSRLSRWRRTAGYGWVENTERGPRDPKYLYQEDAVRPIILTMTDTSGERPAKKN